MRIALSPFSVDPSFSSCCVSAHRAFLLDSWRVAFDHWLHFLLLCFSLLRFLSHSSASVFPCALDVSLDATDLHIQEGKERKEVKAFYAVCVCAAPFHSASGLETAH